MTGRFHHNFALLLFLSLSVCPLLTTFAAEPKPVSFEIASVPRWVKPIAPVVSTIDANNGGISYLLMDQQERIEPKASYYHEARQITSETGVQHGAAINTSFDPSFQNLIFHFIKVVRKGVATERLDRSQIKLLQREKDMELFLYDGAFTAHCHLEDVRVGDVIEFAYTVEGANPAKKGNYSATLATDWYYPVRRAVTRFVYPAQRKVNFRAQNREVRPSITTENGITEWLLDETNVPKRKTDDDSPAGYDPCGWIQASDYASWAEVVDWAVPLYQAEEPVSTDLQAEIDKLRGIPDAEERVLTALRFVQDEIRYLGIESGGGSFQPTASSEVLRRRFGDCKDKACLLSTLLRWTGIDATPALVSGSYRSTVAERLPSSGVFDHVIVQVQIGANTHWLDATRSSQRGPLSQSSVGDFGYALVLRKGTKALTAFTPPRDSFPRRKVTENYRLPAPGGAGHLEVISDYYGRWAEKTRAHFQESAREKIQKDYLQYYAHRFPGIQTEKLLQYEDLPGENSCKTREFYLIQNVWQLNRENQRYELFLYPGDVAQDMGSPGGSQREDPLELDHPISSSQEINAEMFQDWPVEGEDQDVTNSFYRFRHDAKSKGRHLQFNYVYESSVDRVSVADLPRYNSELTKLKDTLGYTLTYNDSVPLAWVKKWAGQLNWTMAAFLLCALTVGMFVSAWLIYKSELPVPLPPLPTTLPITEGIGGWLVPVAVQHLLQPVIFTVPLTVIFPKIFHVGTWRLLTDPPGSGFHPYWATLLRGPSQAVWLSFELFFYSLYFLFSIFLLILFFQKRLVWRRWYVVFLLALVAGVGLDLFLAQQIPSAGGQLSRSVGLALLILAALIWIPYCLVSTRVKATFRY